MIVIAAMCDRCCSITPPHGSAAAAQKDADARAWHTFDSGDGLGDTLHHCPPCRLVGSRQSEVDAETRESERR